MSCKWERWCYSVPINISNSKSCTAECERGFSCMNIAMTDLRSTLLIDHVASLMFINIHGPRVCRWNPQTYVNSWTVRHRDAADTRTLGAVKTVIRIRCGAFCDLLTSSQFMTIAVESFIFADRNMMPLFASMDYDGLISR